jgi:hypothetical protein
MQAQRFPLSCVPVMQRYYVVLGVLLATMFGCMVIGGGFESDLFVTLSWLSALAFALWFLTMLMLPVRVNVGEDGLYAWYGLARRYVPMDQVEEVTPPIIDGSVSVTLSDGTVLRFRGEMGDAGRMADCLSHILKVRKKRDLPESVFARGGRSFAEWSRAARALVDATASYRAAKAPRSLALEHATNERLPPNVRIGAVLAIAPDATDEEKRALVRVVEGIASPSLKRVFEHAATGNLEKAEAANLAYEQEMFEDGKRNNP